MLFHFTLGKILHAFLTLLGRTFPNPKKAIIKAILALILFWGVDFYQLPILLVLFANGLVR
jgi:hypothetical protein